MDAKTNVDARSQKNKGGGATFHLTYHLFDDIPCNTVELLRAVI